MRLLALVVAAAALLASGCSNACQDLGERLCDCTTAGSTKASCVDSVKAEIQQLNPGKDAQDVCSEKLSSCFARKNPETGRDVGFCDWLDGRCGKAACGLSNELYSTLSGKNPDGSPLTPDPANPSQPLCMP